MNESDDITIKEEPFDYHLGIANNDNVEPQVSKPANGHQQEEGHFCSVCSRTFMTETAFELHAHGDSNSDSDSNHDSSSSQDSDDESDEEEGDDDISQVDSISDLDSDIDEEILNQFMLQHKQKKQKPNIIPSKTTDAKGKRKRSSDSEDSSSSDDSSSSSKSTSKKVKPSPSSKSKNRPTIKKQSSGPTTRKSKRRKQSSSDSSDSESSSSSSSSGSKSSSITSSRLTTRKNSKSKSKGAPKKSASSKKTPSTNPPRKRGRPPKPKLPSETKKKKQKDATKPKKVRKDTNSSKSYLCSNDECPGIRFEDRTTYEKHLRHVHGLLRDRPGKVNHRRFLCTVEDCERRFFDADALAVHKRGHSEESCGRFKCTEGCPKSFSLPFLLKKHIKEFHPEAVPKPQTNPNPKSDPNQDPDLDLDSEDQIERIDGSTEFKCPLCSKTFKTWYILRKHRKLFHDPSTSHKHPCPSCDKVFVTKGYLKEHVDRVHLKKKDVTCPDCPKLFSDRSALRKHRNAIHLKLRPHLCENCGRGFKSTHELKRHRWSAHGADQDDPAREQAKLKAKEAPVLCSICGKSYSSKASLQRHLDAHAGYRPYKCHVPGCNAEYLQSPSLKTHLLNKHPGVDLALSNLPRERSIHLANAGNS